MHHNHSKIKEKEMKKETIKTEMKQMTTREYCKKGGSNKHHRHHNNLPHAGCNPLRERERGQSLLLKSQIN